MNRWRLVGLPALWLAACQTAPGEGGTLLLVGGGLDDDTRSVYECLLRPCRGAVRVVVATAATGPQDVEATDKSEALRTWSPTVPVEVVRRETPADETAAAFDRASSVFFTGGDQKRITARYRPADQAAPTPEWSALQRLLDRGGVLGGGSAGCAMMGERMLLGGRSRDALGIAPLAGTAPAAGATPPTGTDVAAGEPPPLGPRLGPGMGFLPGVLTDSHFFERERIGRLVAALMQGPDKLGLGVGEDAALAIDVRTRHALGLTASESLLIDATFAQKDGDRWVGLRARCIGRDEQVALGPLGATPPRTLPQELTNVREVPLVEPGQNRQLASWRLFRQAAVPGAGVLRLRCDGYSVLATAEGDGSSVVFELRLGD